MSSFPCVFAGERSHTNQNEHGVDGMENQTEKLLREIYREARGGCETVCSVTPKIHDRRLMAETARQMEMYSVCQARAEQMLQDKDLGGVTFSALDRLSLRGGVWLETMDMHDAGAIASFLQSNFRDSAARMRNAVDRFAYTGCDADALALGRRLSAAEAAEAEVLRRLPIQ